jgi:prophage regulatory protein
VDPVTTQLSGAGRIVRLPEVLRRVGLRRSSLYRQISLGMFPRPIRLGLRASGWLEAEVDDWINERIRASRPGEEKDAE